MGDQTLLSNRAGHVVRMEQRLRQMESALTEIRELSNYPGKGRSRFADLALMRKKVNKLAGDALRGGSE
jgi:hypothetical protein